jgi:hypothetical protein
MYSLGRRLAARSVVDGQAIEPGGIAGGCWAAGAELERSVARIAAVAAIGAAAFDSMWRRAFGLDPNASLALRMFPKVFPWGMKTAPGLISGGRSY